MFRIILYMLAIVGANVITAATPPSVIGPLIIPWGSYLIGVTFIARDLVQNKYGRLNAYKAIAGALLLSALVSWSLGDPLTIVLASAITFAVGETADTEIYTRIKTSVYGRVILSGLFGGILDSAVFVIIGLSPIGAGFVPWSAVPFAILGQTIIKFTMQLVGVFALRRFIKKDFNKAVERGYVKA